MSREDAERRLRTFERGHSSALVHLASHAALPVVLDPALVHLLRVNYFLDPPTTLPYTAEAELLLSPVCTEVDQGLYVIDPDLRDVLLQHLVRQHGSSRLLDVARLLWEYGQRGMPWSDRPGLLEAQQLTALNIIDPVHAQDWLTRAEEGNGTGTAADKRWFVAMRRDLEDRTAAVQRAGEQAGERAEAPASDVPTVFVSCSREDEEWRRRFGEMLKPLIRERMMEVFSADRVIGGYEWRPQLAEAIARSRVALLLVSPAFLASDFIMNQELPALIEHGVRLVPVLVRPCLWQGVPALEGLQWAHDPGRDGPVASSAHPEEQIVRVCLALRDLLMEPSSPEPSGRIFISYRRDDTAWASAAIFDRLAEHFGRAQIFKDIESIQLGENFAEAITAAVEGCSVLLAIIGQQWLAVSDNSGRRRLDVPSDFVRLEIEAAITHNVRVIPILIDGALMPREDQLPPGMAGLARRQALELSSNRFNFDIDRLLRVLDGVLSDA
jgi:hypothetical protein